MVSWQAIVSKIYRTYDVTWQEAIEIYHEAKQSNPPPHMKNKNKNKGKGPFDIKFDYNNISKKTLDTFGSMKILTLKIRRVPVPSFISTYIKLVSFNRANVDYDKLYHLSLLATVENGETIVLEKNEVIKIAPFDQHYEGEEIYRIPIKHKKDLTILNMCTIAREKVGDMKWYSYDAYYNNCQYWIRYLLEAVNLYNKATADFLFQDLTDLIKKTPYLAQKLNNFITHTAALVNKYTGQGKTIEYH